MRCEGGEGGDLLAPSMLGEGGAPGGVEGRVSWCLTRNWDARGGSMLDGGDGGGHGQCPLDMQDRGGTAAGGET